MSNFKYIDGIRTFDGRIISGPCIDWAGNHATWAVSGVDPSGDGAGVIYWAFSEVEARDAERVAIRLGYSKVKCAKYIDA